MTDHIQIRDRREEVLNKYPGLQVGRNGIVDQYITSGLNNGTNNLNMLLDTLTKLNSVSGEDFQILYNKFCIFLLNIFEYEDFIESLYAPKVKSDNDLKKVLLQSDDVKPIIDALDGNTRKLQQLGEDLPDTMTQAEWQVQGEEISKQVVNLVEKQKQLITLGLQDEVVESVDDVARQVFDIMHLEGIEFQEVHDRGTSNYLMAGGDLSNVVLAEFGIQVGDIIAREAGDNTFEYTVKGVGYSKSHRSYPQNRDDASTKFKEALKKGNKARMVLCFSDDKYPDNHHMISLGGIETVDKEGGIFTIDNSTMTYMKI